MVTETLALTPKQPIEVRAPKQRGGAELALDMHLPLAATFLELRLRACS